MAWLEGWDNRVAATIPAGALDTNLTWFPVLLKLGASVGINSTDITFIFDELQSDANRKKIAVTKADGTTELYVEIEKWDHATETAWLWISRTGWSLDYTVDNLVYLYFDIDHADNTTYVGDVDSTPGQAVWDSYFKGVWHLSEASGSLLDSTGNNNDLTAYNTPTYGFAGKIGTCLDFNAAQIENLKRASAVVTAYPLTIELWGNLDAGSYALGVVRASSQYAAHLMIAGTKANYYVCAGPSTDTFCETLNSISLGVWGYFVAIGHSATLRNSYLNADVANKGTSVTSRNPSSLSQTQSMILDATWGANVGPGDGRVDELRISNTDRTEAWIKATYDTTRDYFLAWGTHETTAVAPTVTTDDCSDAAETTLQANGAITDTGGENPHTRGFCYMKGAAGDPTTANDKVFDNGEGSYEAESYSIEIPDLRPSTSYRVRAYAINLGGTGYGTTVTGETTPAVAIGYVDPTSYVLTVRHGFRQLIGYVSPAGIGATIAKGARKAWSYVSPVSYALWWTRPFTLIRVNVPERIIEVSIFSKTITVSFDERTIKVR